MEGLCRVVECQAGCIQYIRFQWENGQFPQHKHICAYQFRLMHLERTKASFDYYDKMVLQSGTYEELANNYIYHDEVKYAQVIDDYTVVRQGLLAAISEWRERYGSD